jgi:DNA polymerase-4
VRLGFKTIGDLASLDETAMARRFSRATHDLPGPIAHLWRLARGEDERVVEADRAARSYGEENTFPTDVADPLVLSDAVGQHAEAVARRLRRDHVVGEVVRLKVKSTERLALPGKYRSYTRQTTLAAPTNDGGLIARTARALLERGDLPLPVRLIGVAVAGIQPATPSIGEQMSIFEPSRSSELNRALDAITDRFGTQAIRRGVGGAEKASPTLGVKRGE